MVSVCKKDFISFLSGFLFSLLSGVICSLLYLFASQMSTAVLLSTYLYRRHSSLLFLRLSSALNTYFCHPYLAMDAHVPPFASTTR